MRRETRLASPGQLALAWLLHVSPVVLPIPGTSSSEHLRENLAAQDVVLSPTEIEHLAAAVQ